MLIMLKNFCTVTFLFLVTSVSLIGQNRHLRVSLENVQSGIGVNLRSNESVTFFEVPSNRKVQIGFAAIRQIGKYSLELQINVPLLENFERRTVDHFILDEELLFGYGRAIQMSSFFAFSRIFSFRKSRLNIGVGLSPNYQYAHYEPIQTDKYPMLIKAYSLNSYLKTSYDYQFYKKFSLNIYALFYIAEYRNLIYDSMNRNIPLPDRTRRFSEFRFGKTPMQFGVGITYQM